MADTDVGMPFIKNEPEDGPLDSNPYMMSSHAYGDTHQQFGHPFNNHGMSDAVDPLDLQNGGLNMQYSFGSQQNLASNFNVGNSGIGDDELLDLDLNLQQAPMKDYNGGNNEHIGDNYRRHQASMSLGHQAQMNQIYSSPPESGPMTSPYLGTTQYDQFRPVNGAGAHMTAQPKSAFRPDYVKRGSSQATGRRNSEQLSPLTPRTPAVSALHLGTPDSGNFASHPIQAGGVQNRHRRTQTSQWDATPNSLQSYVDSPISSPGNPSHHTNISEVIRSGKHASLPAKVDTPGAGLESLDAKKKRRRASHNAVERRRRDNINERIQDLSHLVPQHRLEDDKVRKQIVNNTPVSPTTGATSMSPPNAATSLLAGAAGRRAANTAGSITLGLPAEDKEKGPNKGDILNGSVSWTRDLMWALYNKYMQEDELQEQLRQHNVDWPFETTEDEKRLRSELVDAMEKNDPHTFAYTRTNGSGLRVPRHTNLAGEPIADAGTISPQSLSPPFQNEEMDSHNGNNLPGQARYWHNGGHAGISFKEEDEYSMEMN